MELLDGDIDDCADADWAFECRQDDDGGFGWSAAPEDGGADRFRVVSAGRGAVRLGGGGFGVVVKARLRVRGRVRDVAAKAHHHLLDPGAHGVSGDTERGRQLLQRTVAEIQRELRALAALSHPGLVPFLGAAWVSSFGRRLPLWLLTELIEGGSLHDRIYRSPAPMPWAEAAGILLPVCSTLGYIHAKGMVHCDLKPENVLLRGGTDPLLTDMGVCACSGKLGPLTQRSSVGGHTDTYLCPEGPQRPEAAARDVWALGVCALEMLLRAAPSLEQLGMMQMRAEGSCPELAAVLRGCLDSDPCQRWSVHDAIRELAAALSRAAATVGTRAGAAEAAEAEAGALVRRLREAERRAEEAERRAEEAERRAARDELLRRSAGRAVGFPAPASEQPAGHPPTPGPATPEPPTPDPRRPYTDSSAGSHSDARDGDGDAAEQAAEEAATMLRELQSDASSGDEPLIARGAFYSVFACADPLLAVMVPHCVSDPILYGLDSTASVRRQYLPGGALAAVMLGLRAHAHATAVPHANVCRFCGVQAGTLHEVPVPRALLLERCAAAAPPFMSDAKPSPGCAEGDDDVACRLRTAEALCAAVAHLHSRGVLHRDLRRPSVVFTEDGSAKLSNFDVARIVRPGCRPPQLTAADPQHSPPETAPAAPHTCGADVYSLTVTLLEILGHFGTPAAPPTSHPRRLAVAESALAAASTTPNAGPLLLAGLSASPSDRPTAAALESALRADSALAGRCTRRLHAKPLPGPQRGLWWGM